MRVEDVISAMREPETYYGKMLEELKTQSVERGLRFASQGAGNYGLTAFVRPGKRTFFGVEDTATNRAILGMILVPNPNRMHSDVAWNRIEGPLKEKLSNLDRNGLEGKKIACVVLQIWEREQRTVVIPLRELMRVSEFRNRGDFHVKKVGGEFFLQTPTWEENVKLNDRLEDLFRLITT